METDHSRKRTDGTKPTKAGEKSQTDNTSIPTQSKAQATITGNNAGTGSKEESASVSASVEASKPKPVGKPKVFSSVKNLPDAEAVRNAPAELPQIKPAIPSTGCLVSTEHCPEATLAAMAASDKRKQVNSGEQSNSRASQPLSASSQTAVHQPLNNSRNFVAANPAVEKSLLLAANYNAVKPASEIFAGNADTDNSSSLRSNDSSWLGDNQKSADIFGGSFFGVNLLDNNLIANHQSLAVTNGAGFGGATAPAAASAAAPDAYYNLRYRCFRARSFRRSVLASR